MRNALEKEFDDAMLSIYIRARDEADYVARRFIEMLEDDGGLSTARKLLYLPQPSEGYTALWERGRLDLTVEALILQPRWAPLFTTRDIEIAKQRLADYGYEFEYAHEQLSEQRSLSFLPEEIPDAITYREGTTRQIKVNAYERNARAREACVTYYGPSCVICGLNFRDRYGDAGDGIIHVHHLVQLSDIDDEYQVNPIRDLRPVCPNCHSVIHRRNPPYSIDEVRSFLK